MSTPWWQLAWLWLMIAGVVAAAGVALLARALFHDRARGRQRCPKCWYDLTSIVPGPRAPRSTGATSCTCPECGHTAARPGQLLRTRRHWRAACASLLLIILALGAWVHAEIIAGTWPRRIPSWILVRFWPIDEVAWFERRAKGPLIDELNARLKSDRPYEETLQNSMGPPMVYLVDGWMSHSNAAAWANRVADAVRTATLASSDSRVTAIYDLGPLFAMPVGVRTDRPAQVELMPQAIDLMMLNADFDGWTDMGGTDNEHTAAGAHWIVRAPPSTHTQIRDFLDRLRTAIEQSNARARPDRTALTPP